jgi:hypothetical protein
MSSNLANLRKTVKRSLPQFIAKHGLNPDRPENVHSSKGLWIMPNILQTEQTSVDQVKGDERETLKKLISEQVIHALGMPIDLRSVQVRKVWGDNYRVNVIVGPNAGAVRVSNSFFLKIDNDGRVVNATPAITKQY